MSQYGHESLWRDTVTTGAERARDLAARLERRAKVADEIAARDAYLGLLDIVVNYEQAVEPFRRTDRLSASERAVLMGGACAKAYRWSPQRA